MDRLHPPLRGVAHFRLLLNPLVPAILFGVGGLIRAADVGIWPRRPAAAECASAPCRSHGSSRAAGWRAVSSNSGQPRLYMPERSAQDGRWVQALFMRLHGCVLDASQHICEFRQCLVRNRRRKLGLIWLAGRVQRIRKLIMRSTNLPNGGRTASVRLSLACSNTPFAWLRVLKPSCPW